MTDQPKRTCGGCTLCCKLIGVKELEKPTLVWCQYCAPGKGCRIQHHEDRPKTCGEFECLWLQGLGSDDMRPDRTKVVMATTTDGKSLLLHVDPTRPDAWRSPKFKGPIDRIVLGGGRVVVVVGAKRTLVRGRPA